VAAPLPPAARRFIATVAVARFGTGLTLPFTLILLHEVRGIPLPTVGLLLAFPGVVGLAAVPVGGALIDRLGARPVLTGCLVLQAAGNAVLAFATSPATALPALLLLGLGLGPSFPASSALLNGLVEGPLQVQRAFGLQFTALNASIGVGGLVGAVVVDVERAATFEVLYLVNAAAVLFQAGLLPKEAGQRHHAAEDEDKPSYREALADPVLRRVCLVTLALALTGYAALDSGFPAFARVEGDISPSVIALSLVANTTIIVAGQLLVLRLIAGRRRSSALAVGAALWALSWASLGLVPGLDDGTRIAMVLLFGGLFGVGETFSAPTLQPLVNGIATDRLRGRYNALSGLMFSIGFVVAPAVSGFMIGHGLGTAWLAGMVALGVLAAVVSARLARALTPEQDGLEPASPLQAEGEGRLEVVP
jgi:MFS family permease